MASTAKVSASASLWRSPIPPVALGLLAGQLVAGERWSVPPYTVLGVAVVAAAACLWRPARMAGLAALAACVGLGQVRAVLRPPAEPDHVLALAPGPVHFRGWVAVSPLRLERKTRLLLHVETAKRNGHWRPAHGKVMLTLIVTRKPWRLGTVLEATLRLRRPRNFGNPGEFDYEGYLARRGVFVTAFAYDDDELEICGQRRSWRGWLAAQRAKIVRSLARRTSSPVREILGALILGARESVPAAVQRDFAAAGVGHLLAISGLHVGMVGGAAFLASWWLLTRSRWVILCTSVPKLAAVMSFLPVLFYAALARGRVATMRAVLMVAVFVLAAVLERQRNILVTIAAAALAISVVWPGAVIDASFQLSFVSVLGLVLGMQRFWNWWRRYEEARLLALRARWWRWAGFGLGYVMVGVWALIATAPLTALHFNQVSLAAVIANPIVVPLLGSAAVGFGLLGAAGVLLYEPLGAWPIALAAAAVRIGVRVTAAIASLPLAALRVVTPSRVEIVLFYGAVLAFIALRGRRRQVVVGAVVALLVLDVTLVLAQRYGSGKLRVTFMSVGHGDCTVVKFPGAKVMVVDGGGLVGFDVGERVVAPYLWRSRIGRVDYLVLTHPQRDHYGGLAFLAREFHPREFWYSGLGARGQGYQELVDAVAASGARQVVARQGQVRAIGGCRLRIINPSGKLALQAVNDWSLVLQIACGSATVLLPGDLEAGGEAQVVARGYDLRSAVLKAGHHGSRTSSSLPFLDAVEPRLAVFSVGYGNRFGLPDTGVLARYRERGVQVFRTDRNGAVTIEAGADGRFDVRCGRTGAGAVVGKRR